MGKECSCCRLQVAGIAGCKGCRCCRECKIGKLLVTIHLLAFLCREIVGSVSKAFARRTSQLLRRASADERACDYAGLAPKMPTFAT